ncbi:MAG: helix-turn-helix domain-containing protein [Saprospiraceae bacterium]
MRSNAITYHACQDFKMNFIDIIYLIVASQGFLLAILLTMKKGSGIYLPLIVFLFLISIDFTFQFLYSSKVILNYPHLIYINVPLNMLKGVLVFMYVRNIYYGKPTYFLRDLLFFIPFLLYFLHYCDFYLYDSKNKVNEFSSYLNQGIFMLENLAEWALEIFVTLPFVGASIHLLNQFDFKVRNEFSDLTYYNFSLARKFLVGVIIIYGFEIITIILAYFGFPFAGATNAVTYLVCGILLYLVGYDALIRQDFIEASYQPSIWKPDNNVGTEDVISEAQTMLKYKHNVIPEIQSEAIIKQLCHCMDFDKLYRNPEIRLTALSKILDESPNNVSQIINQKFNQNFYDFINSYRVKEASAMLVSSKYQHLTIESVGYDVGFKSKSTFYTAFKKFTHLTPVEYKNKNYHN